MRPLPNTSDWQPKQDQRMALRGTFLQTCRSVEARIKAESDIEKGFNINNFDAGPALHKKSRLTKNYKACTKITSGCYPVAALRRVHNFEQNAA